MGAVFNSAGSSRCHTDESTNPERYSYKAAHRLKEAGHPIVNIGIKEGEVAGEPIYPFGTAVEGVDTVTLYIGPKLQPQHYSYGAPPVPRSGPNHKESHHGQNPRRHRGGHREGGNRGRGGHHGDRRQNNKHNHNTPQQHKTDASSGKKKKRRTNTLGLTPGNESESDDDEGEEQSLSNLLGEEAMRYAYVKLLTKRH